MFVCLPGEGNDRFPRKIGMNRERGDGGIRDGGGKYDRQLRQCE